MSINVHFLVVTIQRMRHQHDVNCDVRCDMCFMSDPFSVVKPTTAAPVALFARDNTRGLPLYVSGFVVTIS